MGKNRTYFVPTNRVCQLLNLVMGVLPLEETSNVNFRNPKPIDSLHGLQSGGVWLGETRTMRPQRRAASTFCAPGDACVCRNTAQFLRRLSTSQTQFH